jgi:hypothetical protein
MFRDIILFKKIILVNIIAIFYRINIIKNSKIELKITNNFKKQ